MKLKNDIKCVMVIDENLPRGIIANTAAILGITLGKMVPELIGEDAKDASLMMHLGIITVPVPILKGNKEVLRDLRQQLYSKDYEDMVVVDFSDVAQSCNVYDEYIKRAALTPENKHTYYGLGICGYKKKVNKLTGSMPLLR